MKIHDIQLNKIHPDKNQPRQNFDSAKIQDLANSIKKHGIINPIEIDKNYQIITGERRWRAAKRAGLKNIPCKIITCSNDYVKLLRQVAENIHGGNNTMSPHETAQVFELLITKYFPTLGDTGYPTALHWLSNEISKNKEYISGILKILDASPAMQKAIANGVPYTFLFELRNLPELIQEVAEQKILSGEIKLRDGLRLIKRYANKYPDKAEELIAQDYSSCKTINDYFDVVAKVISIDHEISLGQKMHAVHDYHKGIYTIANHFLKWIADHPKPSIDGLYAKDVISNFIIIKNAIDKWLQDPMLSQDPVLSFNPIVTVINEKNKNNKN